jgi:hypothetical protein
MGQGQKRPDMDGKVTMRQLTKAADVLMGFLEEYQTINDGNADEVVEYEQKLRRIAVPLNSKRLAHPNAGGRRYSVVDLLRARPPKTVSGETQAAVTRAIESGTSYALACVDAVPPGE